MTRAPPRQKHRDRRLTLPGQEQYRNPAELRSFRAPAIRPASEGPPEPSHVEDRLYGYLDGSIPHRGIGVLLHRSR
jgi:hypothetical protein